MTKLQLLILVDKQPKQSNGCIIWPYGKAKDGYGILQLNNKFRAPHRELYKLYYNKDLPKSILVRHTCDNRACVNIEHLVEGTHQDNMNDMVTRNRSYKPKGSLNVFSKLTESQVKEIKTSNVTTRILAKKFKMSRSQISRIKTGRSWSASPA